MDSPHDYVNPLTIHDEFLRKCSAQFAFQIYFREQTIELPFHAGTSEALSIKDEEFFKKAKNREPSDAFGENHALIGLRH